MATTNYAYWAESEGVLTGWNYYSDPGLTEFAFTIGAYRNLCNKISLFDISAGSVSPNTIYYRLVSITTGSGNLSTFRVDDDIEGITGIGDYLGTFGILGCIYKYAGTGVFTPTKTNYTFAPTNTTTTQTCFFDFFSATYNPVPSKAINPTPSNAADDVTLDQETVAWENGGGATSYNVYYGITSGNLILVSEEQEATSFTVLGITNGAPFNYWVTRYWRIDAVNDAGTTVGDEWSFTTIKLNPPTVIYWFDDGGYYYRLIVQPDGSYGDPPPTGTEDVDYVILAAYLPNFIRTQKKLVAAANNKIWYEQI